MPYIPKSQYDVKYTNGQELYNPRTGEEYKGDYIQYGQKYFAGNTITNLKVKLEKIDNEENLILKNTRNFLYNQLNNKHYKKVKKRFRPVASKARPTEKDYEKGIWIRYFCQQVNRHENIFELNTEGYKKFKQGEYDNVLYRSGEIKWSLRESQINNDNVLKLIRQYPNIQFLFNNPGEFVQLQPQNPLLNNLTSNSSPTKTALSNSGTNSNNISSGGGVLDGFGDTNSGGGNDGGDGGDVNGGGDVTTYTRPKDVTKSSTKNSIITPGLDS